MEPPGRRRSVRTIGQGAGGASEPSSGTSTGSPSTSGPRVRSDGRSARTGERGVRLVNPVVRAVELAVRVGKRSVRVFKRPVRAVSCPFVLLSESYEPRSEPFESPSEFPSYRPTRSNTGRSEGRQPEPASSPAPRTIRVPAGGLARWARPTWAGRRQRRTSGRVEASDRVRAFQLPGSPTAGRPGAGRRCRTPEVGPPGEVGRLAGRTRQRRRTTVGVPAPAVRAGRGSIAATAIDGEAHALRVPGTQVPILGPRVPTSLACVPRWRSRRRRSEPRPRRRVLRRWLGRASRAGRVERPST